MSLRSSLGTATLCIFLVLTVAASRSFAQGAPPSTPAAKDTASGNRSPWLLVPLISSSPKLGTSGGALAAYLKTFDPKSRVSIFGASYQYTSTESSVASLFARTSFGADHHRLVLATAFGHIKNDYDDYLGTGKPLKTEDSLHALAGRYLYRVHRDWLVGGQGSATNYQVLGATPEDSQILDTLGVRSVDSAAIGAVVMHDSRDNEDMPLHGWYLNLNNLAYRESLGGSDSYDSYRADFKGFVPHRGRHVLAIRQFNWWTASAPAATQATVVLRGYKFGQYLAPYMSSLEVEERLRFSRRWGATFLGGVAGLYGDSVTPLERSFYPTVGAGLQFVLKPDERMLASLEYAQGIEDNRGVYLKFGYGW